MLFLKLGDDSDRHISRLCHELYEGGSILHLVSRDGSLLHLAVLVPESDALEIGVDIVTTLTPG